MSTLIYPLYLKKYLHYEYLFKKFIKVIEKGQIVINDKNDYSDEKFTTVKN